MHLNVSLLHLLLFVSIALVGCNGDGTNSVTDTLPLEHRFPLKIDGTALNAQVAITFREQSRGLMHREELAANEGMIFIYEAPRQMSFWMKNTLIHLDIGFIDSEGVLKEVHTMVARDTDATQSRSADLRYALEMNAGWFREQGIRPGAKLDLKLLAEAIDQRGFEASRYVDN